MDRQGIYLFIFTFKVHGHVPQILNIKDKVRGHISMVAHADAAVQMPLVHIPLNITTDAAKL